MYEIRNQAVFTPSSAVISVFTASLILLSACKGDEPSQGQLVFNENSGVALNPPTFLTTRLVDEDNLKATLTVNDSTVELIPSATAEGVWSGEVYIPEGSSVRLEVSWIETDVPDLDPSFEGELKLASFKDEIISIDANTLIEVGDVDYDTSSTPELDLDADGFGNFAERQANTDPNDIFDTPLAVQINFHGEAPVIDGVYDDPLWEKYAQFRDINDNELLIKNLLVGELPDDVLEDEKLYSWGAMHDGEFLYIAVITHEGNGDLLGGERQEWADSDEAHNDDSIDLFWDGDNSKGVVYDDVDDYHVIIPLLARQEPQTANQFPAPAGAPSAIFEFREKPSQSSDGIIEFATSGYHFYELKVDILKAGIPKGQPFGLEIQLNNDIDGEDRDFKWAWHDVVEDDVYRFPVQMGTVELELSPLD